MCPQEGDGKGVLVEIMWSVHENTSGWMAVSVKVGQLNSHNNRGAKDKVPEVSLSVAFGNLLQIFVFPSH